MNVLLVFLNLKVAHPSCGWWAATVARLPMDHASDGMACWSNRACPSGTVPPGTVTLCPIVPIKWD